MKVRALAVCLVAIAAEPALAGVEVANKGNYEGMLCVSGALPGAAQTPEAVANVLALYRGPFLPAEEQAPWALSARERLRARTLAFLTAAGGVYERDGNIDGALACYERGMEVENLAEAMYQGAMRCLGALHRRAEAMVVCRRLRHLLSVTLGVQPSAESDALFRALSQE